MGLVGFLRGLEGNWPLWPAAAEEVEEGAMVMVEERR